METKLTTHAHRAGELCNENCTSENGIILKLQAENKRCKSLLEESILTICRLCKRLNPYHKDCTTCDEIEGYREALKESEE